MSPTWVITSLGFCTLTVTSVTASGEAHPTDSTHLLVTPANGYWSGPDVVVTYKVTDPYQQTATSTITVTVDPPAIATGTLSTPMNTAATIDLATHVSGSTGGLSYSFAQPGGTTGSVALLSGTTVQYSPPSAGYFGTTSFTYTVSSTNGRSVNGTVNVTVRPAPPVANNTSGVNASKSTSKTITLSSYVSGGAGTLTYSVGSPTRGSLTLVSGSTYTYWSGSTGAYSFQFTVSDGYGQSSTATVSGTVGP